MVLGIEGTLGHTNLVRYHRVCLTVAGGDAICDWHPASPQRIACILSTLLCCSVVNPSVISLSKCQYVIIKITGYTNVAVARLHSDRKQ